MYSNDEEIDEANLTPLHEYFARNRWENTEDEDMFKYHVDKLYKSESEYLILRTAFDMYAVSFIGLNVQEQLHDKRLTNPYKNALKTIEELFNKSNAQEYALAGKHRDSITERDDECLQWIKGKIDLLETTRTDWKRVQKSLAVSFLHENSIKQYRHKKIFTAFNAAYAEINDK